MRPGWRGLQLAGDHVDAGGHAVLVHRDHAADEAGRGLGHKGDGAVAGSRVVDDEAGSVLEHAAIGEHEVAPEEEVTVLGGVAEERERVAHEGDAQVALEEPEEQARDEAGNLVPPIDGGHEAVHPRVQQPELVQGYLRGVAPASGLAPRHDALHLFRELTRDAAVIGRCLHVAGAGLRVLQHEVVKQAGAPLGDVLELQIEQIRSGQVLFDGPGVDSAVDKVPEHTLGKPLRDFGDHRLRQLAH